MCDVILKRLMKYELLLNHEFAAQLLNHPKKIAVEHMDRHYKVE